jgi:hypothetical protein
MSHAQLLLAPAPSLAEAWLLGSHQRHERLDVPSFRGEAPRSAAEPRWLRHPLPLQPLPVALPAQMLSVGAHLRGQTSHLPQPQALALLLRHLATPLTWQPLNPYAVHRAVPSPRCAYPLQLWVVQNVAGSLQAWRHLSEHLSLNPVALQAPALQAAWPHPRRLLLLAVAAHWQLTSKYGDFTPFVATLEAGHQAAQAAHLAEALGHPAQWLHGEAWEAARVAVCEQPLDALQWGLWLDDMAPLSLPAARSTWVCEPQASAAALGAFPTLPRLLAGFAQQAPGVAGPASLTTLAAPPIDLLQLMRQRSAGNDRPGLFPRYRALALHRLVQLGQAMQDRRAPLPGDSLLRLQLLWLQDTPETPAGLYGLAPLRCQQVQRDAAALLQAALPSPRVRHALHAHVVQLLWSADLNEAEQRLGRGALAQLHLAAGAQAQDWSLAAAALGLHARALRMNREAVLESALPLAGPLIYQLSCGTPRSANPRWELL